MKLYLIRNDIDKPYTYKTPFWLDLFILLLCVVISYAKPLPFPWKVPLIAAVLMGYIYAYHRNLKPLGMQWVSKRNTLIWGLLIAVIVVVGISNLLNPFVEYLIGQPVDTSAYGPLKGNFPFLADYWWKAMLSAAIAEEIFYRGYCFYIIERLLGSGMWQKITIVLLTSVYFGLSHNFQGPSGVIGIMAASIVFGSGYFLSGRNLWAVIVGHALIDTWSLFSLYHGGIRLFF